MGNASNRNLGDAQNTSVGERNLTEDDLVHMDDEGISLVAMDNGRGIRNNASDVFVRASPGEVGIYHPEMIRRLKPQQTPRYTGTHVNDQMRRDIDFCDYADKQRDRAGDEVYRLLGKLPMEQQQESMAFLKDIDEMVNAEAQGLGLSLEAAADYAGQQTFRALYEKYRGTALGNRASEAHALGNYSAEPLNHRAAKYGVPVPGQGSPCNASGRSYYDYISQIQDRYVQAQLERQQILQFLSLTSLFTHSGMGMCSFLAASWME